MEKYTAHDTNNGEVASLSVEQLEVKVCNKCSLEKPIDDFVKNRTWKGGITNTCKKCSSSGKAAWLKARIESGVLKQLQESMAVDSKTCNQCGELKSITMFSKQKSTKDGFRNKCKTCSNHLESKRREKIDTTPELLAKKRAYAREYKINNSIVSNNKNKKQSIANYINTYDEKYRAKTSSQHIEVQAGYHKHHWSYNEIHYKDVIILSVKDHAMLHTALAYDQSIKMYRRVDNGEVMATRESHLDLISELELNKQTGFIIPVKFISKNGKIHEL